MQPGKPTTVSFTIRQPDGQPLTQLQARPGPAHGRAPDHRPRRPRDDRPQATRRSRRTGRSSETITFPAPGRYRMVVDAYPQHRAAAELPAVPLGRVAGKATTRSRCRRSAPTRSVDGYRFAMHGHADAEGDPGDVAHHRRHRPERASRRSSRRGTARSRTRSSSAGLARLLPHARLRARRERLHELARRRQGRPARRRRPGRLTVGRARPGAGHVAAVPPVPRSAATS